MLEPVPATSAPALSLIPRNDPPVTVPCPHCGKNWTAHAAPWFVAFIWPSLLSSDALAPHSVTRIAALPLLAASNAVRMLPAKVAILLAVSPYACSVIASNRTPCDVYVAIILLFHALVADTH